MSMSMYIYRDDGILLGHKKNEAMPFMAAWVDLEIIQPNKSERERQILYDITYMWNLKELVQMNLLPKQKLTQT